MKLLILLSATLAVASANIPGYYGYSAPLIAHNGVPVDTPEVQAAKALHFAAHAAASHGTPLVYTGHYGVPNVAPDGRPLDTPEVQLAKAAHFIAYNQAAVRNAVGGHYGAVAAVPIGPIDTPEVQIAKAAHFAAHAQAKSHYRKRRAAAYYGPPPQIGSNGVPLDTPEVQALKAQHFAAHSRLNTQNNYAPNNYAPNNYAHQDHYEYHGQYGYHIPVIGPNGVPVEPPANQAERAKHLSSYNGGYNQPAPSYGGYYPGQQNYGQPGVPSDTPEVAAARAAHLAAHAHRG